MCVCVHACVCLSDDKIAKHASQGGVDNTYPYVHVYVHACIYIYDVYIEPSCMVIIYMYMYMYMYNCMYL